MHGKRSVVGHSLVLFLTLSTIQSRYLAAQTHTTTAAPPNQVMRPDSIQDSGFYDYWTQMSGQGRAGGVLLGKLAVEGGRLPWEPMLVSVDCKGKVVNMTQTDLKGRYVIRFIDTEGTPGIPEDAQRQMERKYEGCTVQAVLAGFRSNSVTITQRNLLDEPNLATIMLSPEGRGGGTEVSSTSAEAPPNAMRAFDKARADWLDQKSDASQHELEKAVKLYASFAEAWLYLGKLEEPSDPQGAREAFNKALAADPQYILPYEQLAALATQQEKWQEALDNTTKALQLDPAGTPQIWYYDALAKYQLAETDDAQASAEKALAIDPRHSVMNIEQLLAVILARKADYAGALGHLRSSLTYLPPGSNADLVKQQIAHLEQKMPSAK
jgi:cytochrome c-type biogenesis protein CcmH/NrfG